MPLIEGFRIQNYRALRDVTIGRVAYGDVKPLTPLTAVIGKNGSGKSTLFDAFGFIADCLASDVENACDMKQRGGFERLRTADFTGPISFTIYYREGVNERPITYELSVNLDDSGRPFVEIEVLKQRRKGQKHGQPFPFLRLDHGRGMVWAGEESVASSEKDVEGYSEKEEDSDREYVELTDPRQLGIATLGNLKEHPRIGRFRNFLKSWYLSYFYPDAARTLPMSNPQRHLNSHGDNIANVVQFMEREDKPGFERILAKIAGKIPGIHKISTLRMANQQVLLQFNDGAFKEPFISAQMSDGTLKLFAYYLLLEAPDSPPFICIEEPENGLYHMLLEDLAAEFRSHTTNPKNGSQIFITTHQPSLVNALTPEEVWILKKGDDGYSQVKRVSASTIVTSLVAEELPLGGLWTSDYLD